MSHNSSRRDFLKKTLALAAAVPAARLLTGGFQFTTAFAAPVADTDPVAKALGYVPDAKKTDKKKYPQYKAGQNCANCALYTAVDKNAGKCQMIQSGEVSAKGWCGSYSKKA
jgi:anaerobic selenocysteine-containing dehydrogenase